MAAVFDTLRYSQRLQQVGVSRDQAEAHAELARDMIIAELVTKGDLAASVKDLQAELRDLQSEIKLSEQRITIRLGGMLVAIGGVIIAAQRFLA